MTDDRKRTDRGIDLTIDIDATLEEVWQALTTGEGIARWFAPHAVVTPGEGGSVSIGWDPKEMWSTPITVWEPGRRMQTASEMPTKDGGVDVDATVAVRHTSRTIAFVVPAWNDALLFVEREGMKEAHQLGVWLSLYGVPETTAASLRQGLADLQSALSVPEG